MSAGLQFGGAPPPRARRRSAIWRTLRSDPWTVLGGLLVLAFFAAAALAPALAPHPPTQGNILDRLQPPSREHLLGTDGLGRDLLSRLLYGARISGLIGFLAVSVSGTLGVVFGALAGFYGGWTDTLVGRSVDTLLAFPGILLAILVLAVTGPGLSGVVIAVGIFGVPSYARVVRGTVLSVKEREFAEAARALGSSHLGVLFKHVLPNAMAPVIVLTSLNLGTAILTAATLSFLGVGVQPPAAEWGSIIAEGRQYLRVAPHVTTITGIAIFLTILGFNLLGDGLRDALDPRTQRR